MVPGTPGLPAVAEGRLKISGHVAHKSKSGTRAATTHGEAHHILLRTLLELERRLVLKLSSTSDCYQPLAAIHALVRQGLPTRNRPASRAHIKVQCRERYARCTNNKYQIASLRHGSERCRCHVTITTSPIAPGLERPSCS